MSNNFLGDIKNGATDITIPFILRSSSTGALLPGVAYSDVSVYFLRQGSVPVQITLSAGSSTSEAHSDGKWFEIDATNMPGAYQLMVVDSAFIGTNSDWVLFELTGTGIEPCIKEYSIGNLNTDTSGRVLLQAATHTGAVIPTVSTLTGNTAQTGDAYAVVNHATYGNPKLVRSVTPANALDVDAANAAKTQGSSITLSSTERNAIADATLARSLGTESYAADGAVPTTAQMLFQIWSAISEFAITGGGTTKTSKKLNGSTSAMVFSITLDGNGKPVAISRTT